MTWQLAKCANVGNIELQYQELANPWWTSLWVRNSTLPLEKVEVKSKNHSAFFALRRETDGTLNDDGGFGEGPFELRFTAVDGQVLSQSFDMFSGGALVDSGVQFQ
jgi:expansin (peptidoglycan-binding protein)